MVVRMEDSALLARAEYLAEGDLQIQTWPQAVQTGHPNIGHPCQLWVAYLGLWSDLSSAADDHKFKAII